MKFHEITFHPEISVRAQSSARSITRRLPSAARPPLATRARARPRPGTLAALPPLAPASPTRPPLAPRRAAALRPDTPPDPGARAWALPRALSSVRNPEGAGQSPGREAGSVAAAARRRNWISCSRAGRSEIS